MQAISIAIGKTGINFFAQHFLSSQLEQLLTKLKPADRNISVPNFSSQNGDVTLEVSNLSIALSNGSLAGFSPAFQNLVQGLVAGVPAFTLSFQAPGFSANYNWYEAYHLDTITFTPPNSVSDVPSDPRSNFAYAPGFSGMAVTIVIQFAFNSSANAWQMTAGKGSASAQGPVANIPRNSILWTQDTRCFVGHVDETTEASITSTDFTGLINTLINGVVSSIQGSGNLGDNIVYDFTPGDDGLLFPNNDGIQIGVKGGASYNGTAFSGITPPKLPLPAPLADSDTHHLNMYVSNYEVDALTWAFTQAGKLNLVLNPTDVPDPDVLKVKTYVSYSQALEPYQYFAMQARVTQNSAPVTAFQLVYQFPQAVINTLQNQLPASVWNLLNNNIAGNNYASKSDLEANLQGIGIEAAYFPTIEDAAKTMGMVVHHNINYTLVIQTSESPQPTIVFNVTRVDILSNLLLGINANKAQTLQFVFSNVTWNCSFVSSSIPKFDGSVLDSVWGQAGESGYATIMAELGKTGVPLPIMQGFQFDFANAELSIQDSYLSILANVQYNNA
ncbi:MAG TPA: hypothetical protein PKL15_11075 [Saprospiraceae bacterium]|nr:hypothetical protein [Saprospiraceae bacterium]